MTSSPHAPFCCATVLKIFVKENSRQRRVPALVNWDLTATAVDTAIVAAVVRDHLAATGDSGKIRALPRACEH
jgi:hypothetical protein